MSCNWSTRGGHASRRGRGGWSKPFAKPKESTKPDIRKNPLGELLKTLQYSDLTTESSHSICCPTIVDVDFVASYNWLNSEISTIVIPGKPPQWTPPVHNPRLNEDSGDYYRDPNAARYPEFPLAPVVQAIMSVDPAFDASEINVVACGSTMGNLLRFARRIDRPFRFNLEAVGNTVFLIRKENDPKETIPDVRGFGHVFPETYTTWESEVRNSETHQRIVRYDFGKLSCIIRFESDGYLKERVPQDTTRIRPTNVGEIDDELLRALDKSRVTNGIPREPADRQPIKIIRAGCEIPQRSIFDLKTRSGKYKKDIDMTDIYPQLWIKQVPNFIVAYHDGHGLFEDIRIKDIRNEVQQWERDNVDGIRRFSTLLKRIISFAKEHRGLLEVYCPGPDHLEIRKQYGQGSHALPTELSDQWKMRVEQSICLSDPDDRGYGPKNGGDPDCFWGETSDDEEPDYTACSVEECGYCGKCTY